MEQAEIATAKEGDVPTVHIRPWLQMQNGRHLKLKEGDVVGWADCSPTPRDLCDLKTVLGR